MSLIVLMLGVLIVDEQAAVSASQPGAATHTVVAQLEVEDQKPGDEGTRTTVAWVCRCSASFNSELTLSQSDVTGARWLVGSGGATWKISGTAALFGGLTIGGGTMTGAPFDYRSYRGGMRFQFRRRFLLEAEDQYFDVGTARGHLLRVGGGAALHDRLSVQAAYHKGPNAGLRAEFVSTRADSRVGRVGVLGGLSLGATQPVLLGQPNGAGWLKAREYFGGVKFPAGKQTFSVILDAVRSDSFRRESLAFLWQADF